MKKLPALLLAAFALAATLRAAPLGPEVAVLQIQFPGEKQTRQVTIGLNDQAAPYTVENFKHLVRKKFYNGQRFFRVFPGTFLQTGDPSTRRGQTEKTGTGGPGWTLPAEIRLKHGKGAVAMARLPDKINPARSSNGSQFYICLVPAPKLDGQYTVFGTVLEGLEVLDEISKLPTNSNDFPLPKVVIKSIVLAPREPAATQTIAAAP
jgi:cyclophilin family peptidyl-prolyl cis-trans isomerase